MKKYYWIALVLALCLGWTMAAAAEEVLTAPVDAIIEETETDLWTEDIAEAAEAVEANPVGIALTSANFPDNQFLLYLADIADGNHDFVLSPSEIGGMTVLSVYDKGVADLEGIKFFTNLEELYCGSNDLAELDLSGMTKLKKVWCMDNRLYSLDITSCEALRELSCYNNQLETLQCIGCEALEELVCRENKLWILDLDDCAALRKLDCRKNQLMQLNLEDKAALEEVYCGENGMQQLNANNCPALKYLHCNDNQLTELGIGSCESLEYLDCGKNWLRDLRVTSCGTLKRLFCAGNRLERLDTSCNGVLEELSCEDNRLTRLDLSHSMNLSFVDCTGNPIESLDLTASYPLKECVQEGECVLSGCCAAFSATVYDVPVRLKIPAATILMIDGAQVYPATETPPAPTSVADCATVTVKDQTYTGKALKPAPVVKCNGVKLKKGTDYTVSYKNNTKIGLATVTVKGKGNFTGSKKVTFKIIPRAVALSKLTAGKGKLTVKWKKGAGGAGYQLQYATKKDFSNKKTVTIAKTATVSKTIKSLKSGKKYYVRVRAYKKVGGKAYVSAWSKVKSAKVK